MTTTDGGNITQNIICNQNSEVLIITELLYESGLVLDGCVLAYKTHHIDKKVSDSKQPIFAMYNFYLFSKSVRRWSCANDCPGFRWKSFV